MAKKRTRGNRDGSFYQRTNGLWVGVVWVRTPSGTEERKYVSSMDREKAYAKWIKLSERATAGPVDTSSSSLAVYLDYWLADVVSDQCRPSTWASYEMIVRRYIVPRLGRKKLDRLTVADVRSWLASVKRDGASPRMVQLARAVLRSALTNAVAEELLTRNVAALVRVPRPPKRRFEAWTAAEARQFLAATTTHRFYLAFVLVLMLGLRRGEALGVAWDDVDLDAGVLHVRWQIQRNPRTSQLERVPVKTDGSDAVIPLPTPVVNALLVRRDVQEAERRVCEQASEWKAANLVTTTLNGSPIDPRNFNRAFHAACEQAQLRRIRVHDTRHTCATLLRSLGVDLAVIKEILRHAELSITADIYIHVTTEEQRDAVRLLGNVLDPPPQS